ncbi:MAG: glycosyltransferase [Nanoarchaeota archaeon]
MRILHVVDGTYLPKMDGIVVSLVNTTLYLANKGHKVAIAAPEYPGYKDKKQKNITVKRFSSFSFPPYPEIRISHPNIYTFKQLILDFEPNIIHTHTPGTLCLLALLFAKQYNIPIITTYHTSFPDVMIYTSPAKLLKLDFLFNKIKIVQSTKFENIQKKLQKTLEKIRMPKLEKKSRELSRKRILSITNVFYNKHDLVIAPSERIKKDLVKHKLKSKVIVISNGIEIKKFKKKNKYNKFPKFLQIGRVGFEKKIDIVIDAMSILIKKYPKAKLTIVGDGPAMETLKKQVSKLNLEKNVEFTGFVPRNKIAKIYRNHDVFITASEMETQGLVLLEAMASGLPVIGVNVLAIPDVVHNKKTGFLVKRGDYKAIARKMCKFIEEPNLIKEYGRNARIETAKHNIEITLRSLEKTYLSYLK